MLKIAESRLCRPNMEDADCYGSVRNVSPLTLEQYVAVMKAWSLRYATLPMCRLHVERVGFHLVWEVMRCQDVHAALELAHGILSFHTGDPLKASRKPTSDMLPAQNNALVIYGEGREFSRILRDASQDVDVLKASYYIPKETQVWFHIYREHYEHFATVLLFHIIAWLYGNVTAQWPREPTGAIDRYLAHLSQSHASLSPEWFRAFLNQPYRYDEKHRKHIAIPFYAPIQRRWFLDKFNGKMPFAAYDNVPSQPKENEEVKVATITVAVKHKKPLRIVGPPCLQKMYDRILQNQPSRSDILWRAVDGRWDELVDQIPSPERRAQESKLVRRLHDTPELDKKPYGCAYVRKCGLCPLTHDNDIEDVPAFQRLKKLNSVKADAMKKQCHGSSDDIGDVVGRHCATLSGSRDARRVFQPHYVLSVVRME